MCLGNRREKVGRRFQKENDDVRDHDRECIDVGDRDLGMKGTRIGRESGRKIFERGEQRKARLHSEEECKRNRLTVKAGKKSLRTKWIEGKSARYSRSTGEKKTEQVEEEEREVLPEEQVCQ
jgi:hypothetical protein